MQTNNKRQKPDSGQKQQSGPKRQRQNNGQPKPQQQVARNSRRWSSVPPNSKQASVAAAYATGQHSEAPMIVASRDSARIVHRELIASVVGSAGFAVPFSFALNPGLPATFPWLSSQAQAWETYKFNRLRFCYYTRTGSNVPGSVMLVPDYDALDAAPATEQIASSYEDVAEDAPWKDICQELRATSMFSMGPRKFIRTGALPAGADIKTYDAGQEFVCTTDGTAVNWGKLWVEYDVTLFTPQLPPGGSSVSAAVHLAGATPTTANIVGSAPVTTGTSGLISVTGSIVTFNQPGRYFVALSQAATTSVTLGSFPAAAAGASLVISYETTGYTYGGSSTTNQVITALVQTGAGGTLTFSNTIILGLTSDLVVAAVPVSLT